VTVVTGRPSLVAAIWAQTPSGVIGRAGAIPWHLPEDLRRFAKLTRGHAVVMGRRTWHSLGAQGLTAGLPGRDNLVLTRDSGWHSPGAVPVAGLDQALARAAGQQLWVIGGAQIYSLFLPVTERLEVTEVDLTVTGDTHAPAIGQQWRLTVAQPEQGWQDSSTGLRYRFATYRRAEQP